MKLLVMKMDAITKHLANKMAINNGIQVSYGQSGDEYVTIRTLTDEIRFRMCMQLYKTHTTVESLEKVIKKKGLNKIKESR